MTSRGLKILAALLLAVVSLSAGRVLGPASDDALDVCPCQSDRILVLAPHPDDETLACGGIIQKCVALHVPVRIVILTYGDDNEWSFLIYKKFPVFGSHAVEKMGLIRDEEAHRAAARLGLGPDQVTLLGYPDHALQSIWYEHWSGQPPAVGHLSRAREVPYPDAFRPGAPYKGEAIIQDLKAILREFKPTKIFLSHPADTHPDHRSLYLFVRVALWDLEGDQPGPKLFPYLVHFSGWPEHKGLHESLKLDPAPALRQDIRWMSESLDEREVATKLDALRQHKSQHEAGAPFLDAFVRENELFGDFPELVAGRDGAGLGARHVQLQDGRLVIAFDMPPADVAKAHLSLRAFGYRKDVPFAQMPKLHIRIAGGDHAVFEKGTKLDKDLVRVSAENARLLVSLPLEALGNPQRVFLGTRAPLSAGPDSFSYWRIIALPEADRGAAQGR